MICVIEDDKKVRLMISAMLKRAGHEFDCFKSIEEFKDKSKCLKYSIILLDNYLPGENGLNALVEGKVFINTPVVLMTAISDKEIYNKAIKGGAIDFLAKPFSYNQLMASFGKVLKEPLVNLQDKIKQHPNTVVKNEICVIADDFNYLYLSELNNINNSDVYINTCLEDGNRYIFCGKILGEGLRASMLSKVIKKYIQNLLSKTSGLDFNLNRALIKINNFLKYKYENSVEFSCNVFVIRDSSKEIYCHAFGDIYLARIDLYGFGNIISVNKLNPLGCIGLKDTIKFTKIDVDKYSSYITIPTNVAKSILTNDKIQRRDFRVNTKYFNVFDIGKKLINEYDIANKESFLQILPNSGYWNYHEKYLTVVRNTVELHNTISVLVNTNKYEIDKSKWNMILIVLSEYVSNCLLHGKIGSCLSIPNITISIAKLDKYISLNIYHNTSNYHYRKESVKDEAVDEVGGRGIDIISKLTKKQVHYKCFDVSVSRFFL
jgi:CheY-like chemotaxis protein